MGFFLGLLAAVLVVNCIILCLLVLIQLPKKEAGLGLAFGAGAADALFGAGSGNVLTKATKYAAGIFFVLCISLGILQGRYFHRPQSEFQKDLLKDMSATPGASLPSTPPSTVPTLPKPSAEAPVVTTPPATTTSAPATTATAPAAAPKPASNAAPPSATPPANQPK